MGQEQTDKETKFELPEELKTELMKAIDEEDIPGVREILDNSEGMNLDFEHGPLTPLTKACNKKNYPICEMLLKNGADPNKASKGLPAPLNIISDQDNPDCTEIVRLLIFYRATVDIKDSANNTPLHKACYYGAADIVKLLLDNGASVDDPLKSEWSALVRAAVGCKVSKKREIIKLLIAKAPNVDPKALPYLSTESIVMIQEEIDIYKSESVGHSTKAALHDRKVIEADDDDATAPDPEADTFYREWEERDVMQDMPPADTATEHHSAEDVARLGGATARAHTLPFDLIIEESDLGLE